MQEAGALTYVYLADTLPGELRAVLEEALFDDSLPFRRAGAPEAATAAIRIEGRDGDVRGAVEGLIRLAAQAGGEERTLDVDAAGVQAADFRDAFADLTAYLTLPDPAHRQVDSAMKALEAAGNGVLLVSGRGRVVDAGVLACERLQSCPGKLRGRSVDGLIRAFEESGRPASSVVEAPRMPAPGCDGFLLLIGQAESDSQHMLRERTKEFNLVHDAAILVNDVGLGTDEICRLITDRLPTAFRFDYLAQACLRIGDREFRTAGFTRTPWMLEHEIEDGSARGTISIAYTEPVAAVPLFLDEERDLLALLARLLVQHFRRSSAEESALEREMSFRTLAENASDLIVRFDREFRHVYINPAIEQITGHPPDFFIGKTNAELGMPRHLVTQWHDALGKVFRTGKEQLLEFSYSTQGGLRHFQSRISPEINSAGEVQFALSIVRDMTEHGEIMAALGASEERLQNLIDQTRDAIFVLDGSGAFEVLNPAFETITGHRREDWMGRDVADLIHEEDAGTAKDLFERVAEGEEPAAFRIRIVGHRGNVIHVELSVSPFQASGPGIGLLGVARDVSERWKAEEMVRASEERFRAMLHAGTDLIALISQTGRYVYVAPTVTSVLGYVPEELEGRPPWSFIHPDDVRMVRDQFRQLRHHEGVRITAFRFRAKSGEWRWIEAVTRNMLDHPSVRAIVVNGRDVTERTRHEQELVRAKEEAEEMARLKSALLANMSHEIRTPLTGIIGFAQILADEVTGEQQKFAQLIGTSGERLLATLNSLLELASLESGGRGMSLRALAVDPVVRESVELLRPLADKRNLSLEYVTDDAEAYIHADLAGLTRVLHNLIGNGLKFTLTGGVLVIVRAGTDFVRIIVQDTGIGIGEEFLPNLFEAFSQESVGLARTHEGTGLGLSITRRLVEAMGGSISVESEKGKGSSFTVEFRRVEAPPEEPGAGAPQDTEKQAPEGRRSVLVVDDAEDSLMLLKHLLSAQADVATAGGRLSALRMANERAFDLVLLDIHLGHGVSGFDLLHEIRSIPHYRGVPIFAVTAYALAGDRERIVSEGFDGYIPKPFDAATITAEVRNALAGKGNGAGGAPADERG